MLTRKDRMGLWLIGATLLVVIVIVGVKFRLDAAPKAQDDNCVGSPTANTVILLDYSDDVPLQTRHEISARAMAHIRERVVLNERVSVFTISALSKQQLAPVVSLCRPPVDGNRMVENPSMIRKRYLERFEKPLESAFEKVPIDSPESPIAQAIIDLSLSQYLRGSTNTLLVFSDMLENTQRFTILKCAPSSEVVKRFVSSRSGSKERPHFQNTYVQLNLIPRENQPEETLKCRNVLWPWFFGDNSGPNAKVDLDYLPGGPATTSVSPKPGKP